MVEQALVYNWNGILLSKGWKYGILEGTRGMELELVDTLFFLMEGSFESFLLSLIFPGEFTIPASNKVLLLIEENETLEFGISLNTS